MIIMLLLSVSLLYDAESIHINLRTLASLLYLEAGNPDCSFFIRVALAKSEDVFLED